MSMPGFSSLRGQLSPRGTEAGLTCVVESEEHRAGDGKGQDPDDGDHDRDSALGAVTCVVEHGHGHGCVPARARGVAPESGAQAKGLLTPQRHPSLGKGNQSWVFIGRTDAEAETPILLPPHAKS